MMAKKPTDQTSLPVPETKIFLSGTDATILFNDGKKWRNSVIDTREMFDNLNLRSPVNTGVLPAGIVGVFENSVGNTRVYVHEAAPRVIKVNWHSTLDNAGIPKAEWKKQFALAMPYIITLFVCLKYNNKWYFENVECFFRQESLKSFNDKIYSANLDNIDSDIGWVCLGDGVKDKARKQDINEAIKYILSTFWGTKFNGDLFSPHQSYLEATSKIEDRSSGIRYNGSESVYNVYNWEKETLKDPTHILKQKFDEHDKNLKKEIAYLLENSHEDSEVLQELNLDYDEDEDDEEDQIHSKDIAKMILQSQGLSKSKKRR
jgi:hypothetical protein